MAKRVDQRSVRAALREAGGVISEVAKAYEVSRQTVYNWIERYELRAEVESARNLMFDMAQDNLLQAVADGNIDVSKFVLTHMPTPKRWSNRTEITGADGEAMFQLSPDVLALMRASGIEMSDLAREFEAIVKAQAEVQHG